MVVDVLFVLVLVLGYVTGARKGFIKSVWKLLAWIGTILLIWMFAAQLLDFVSHTKIYNEYIAIIEEKLIHSYEKKSALSKIFLSDAMSLNNEGIASVAAALLKGISYILLVVIVRVLVGIVLCVAETFFKLPILSFANKFAGGTLGAINVTLVVLLLLWGVEILAVKDIILYIQSSVFVKYLYENNILLSLFT